MTRFAKPPEWESPPAPFVGYPYRSSSFGLFLLLFFLAGTAAAARSHDKANVMPGFVIELPVAESDVLQAVNEVAQDQVVHGTYQYEKEQTLTGSVAASSSAHFGEWKESGKVFYKICSNVLAPRHFRDSNDMGEITVRYVVQAAGAGRTRLRIDAVFIEDGRRKTHPSDGTVESSEFKVIQERLQRIQLSAQEADEAQKKREREELARQTLLRQREEESLRLADAQSAVRELQQHLQELRHQTEMRVKEGGAELKSAPFRAAATIQPLPSHSELLVLIVTPHWYGVETPDRRHGWIHRQQVEPLP